jgi:hypothetical protein
LPGLNNDPIECTTRLANINESAYEALSYIWGDISSSTQETVIISGNSVAVTSNLHTALRHLRHPINKRTLWIDQLCINQWDNDEKAQQVAMMRDIYKNCTRCIIWFGEFENPAEDFSSGDVQAVFDFFEAVSVIETKPLHEVPVLYQDSATGVAARRAFRAFSANGNPWWSRIWTVQEALIPISAHLQWGSCSVSWDDVQRAALHLCLEEHVDRFSEDVQYAISQYEGLLPHFLYPVRGLQRSANGEAPLKLLMRWRYRKATDPRDKIYALLGLLPPEALPSARHCDYSIPLHALFRNVTLDLLREEQNLRPLIAASEMSHVTPHLPSWAIDFACSPCLGTRHAKWWRHSDRFSQFLACGEERLQMSLKEADKGIRLLGVYVDEVLDVANVYRAAESEEISDGEFRKAIEDCNALLQKHIYLGISCSGGDSFEQAFWRTMIGDLITYERPVARAESHHKHDFDEFVQYGTHNVLYDALSGVLPNHAFFLTKMGYIGVGPPDTQVGDQVWILNGGRLPFVLREKESKKYTCNGSLRFSLVGDAYVHGIMDGEFVHSECETGSVWLE